MFTPALWIHDFPLKLAYCYARGRPQGAPNKPPKTWRSQWTWALNVVLCSLWHLWRNCSQKREWVIKLQSLGSGKIPRHLSPLLSPSPRAISFSVSHSEINNFVPRIADCGKGLEMPVSSSPSPQLTQRRFIPLRVYILLRSGSLPTWMAVQM